jgi:hypothetical protein
MSALLPFAKKVAIATGPTICCIGCGRKKHVVKSMHA